MSKHTPGPWVVRGSDSVLSRDEIDQIVGADDEAVVVIGQGGCPCESDPFAGYSLLEISRENLSLIIAAPELLSACQSLIAAFEKHPGRFVTDSGNANIEFEHATQDIEAAITKAIS